MGGPTTWEIKDLFCHEYIVDMNATKAARRAGVPPAGAHVTASRWLKDAKVAARIQELRADRAERLKITQDRVLEEIAKVAFGQPLRTAVFITPLGDPGIDVDRLDAEDWSAVASVKVDDYVAERALNPDTQKWEPREVRSVEIKAVDRLAALSLLGRHIGLWKDKVEVTIDEDAATQLVRATERLKQAREASNGEDVA